VPQITSHTVYGVSSLGLIHWCYPHMASLLLINKTTNEIKA